MSTRADLLQSNLTPIKEWLILGDLRAYRRCAALLAREQWRRFFDGPGFDRQFDRDKVTFARIVGNAARVQMCRYQTVGMLRSWLSNRENDFRDAVSNSTLPADIRHMLYTINRKQAWFSREPVKMAKGTVIPDDVRRLARSIMRGVMRRHRRPQYGQISMMLDARSASLMLPEKATQDGRLAWWVRLSLYRATPGDDRVQVDVPLLDNPYHARRQGEVDLSVNVVQDRETGKLRFAVTTDQSAVFAASRAAYQPACKVLPVDFGLRTMFATGDGDLLGRNWLDQLRRYDARITAIARACSGGAASPVPASDIARTSRPCAGSSGPR